MSFVGVQGFLFFCGNLTPGSLICSLQLTFWFLPAKTIGFGWIVSDCVSDVRNKCKSIVVGACIVHCVLYLQWTVTQISWISSTFHQTRNIFFLCKCLQIITRLLEFSPHSVRQTYLATTGAGNIWTPFFSQTFKCFTQFRGSSIIRHHWYL